MKICGIKDMTLHGLTEETIQKIIESLPDSEQKEWIKVQFEEQKAGGAWKRRIREEYGLSI